MNWILQTYTDVFRVVLGDGEAYRSSQKCDKHMGPRDKPHWRRPK